VTEDSKQTHQNGDKQKSTPLYPHFQIKVMGKGDDLKKEMQKSDMALLGISQTYI
jgi:hypothetical protein